MTLKTLPRPGSITLRRLAANYVGNSLPHIGLMVSLLTVTSPPAVMKPPVAGCGPANASEFSVNWKDWASQKASGVYRNLAVTSLPCDAVFNSPKAGTSMNGTGEAKATTVNMACTMVCR